MRQDDKTRHDLRNHLSIIAGFSEMLLSRTDATDERHADLEEIHSAAAAALTLLEVPMQPNLAMDDLGRD